MGGQHSSSSKSGGAVPCCTGRGDDEARDPVLLVDNDCGSQASSHLRTRLGRDDAVDLCDGGTGGTGSVSREKPRRDRDDESICSASRLGISCVETRTCGPQDGDFDKGHKALFGERALKPKLQKLRASEAEVEALMKTRTNIDERLPKQAGELIPLPAALEVGATCFSDIELVRRLRLHEVAFSGVAESLIREACARVMKMLSISGGTGSLAERPLEIEEIKKHYGDILMNVRVLVEERISELNGQKQTFEDEVKEIEEAIESCFDKMLEDDSSSTVNEATFVRFICQDYGDLDYAVSPQDAESLFVQMSDGSKELSYEQFKDEVTTGCLCIMQDNMEIRRVMSKQYRDTCI